MPRSDVLVIGAGPTGLVLALWLTKLGVKVRIIDKTAEPGTTSRALAVHARTLELYRQLDLAGGELRVLGSGQPQGDLPARAHDELRAHPRGNRVRLGRVGGVDHDLGDPVAVAQVKEDELAVVAAAMDPAGQARADARVGGAQLAAGMAAVRGRQIGRHGPQS